MHTFVKIAAEKVYSIGVLSISTTGADAFVRLFDVMTIDEAVAAVNFLNGGSAKFPYPYREYDDTTRPAPVSPFAAQETRP
jgi:hypothetical protein